MLLRRDGKERGTLWCRPSNDSFELGGFNLESPNGLKNPRGNSEGTLLAQES